MNKWLKERNLNQLNYQRIAIESVEKSLREEKITILASAPGSGKTMMSIYIIEKYLEANPNHKVLVLAHGTTVLREQFYKDIVELNPNFSSNLVLGYNDYDEESSVNVCLPQTLHNKEISEFDLLVVDEAHQFYFADMVKTIIKKGKPTKQLLLTGTPSPFVRMGLPIIPVSLNDIMEEGMVSDLYVQIASSSYSFDLVNDYNHKNDLKKKVKITESETNKTLDDLIGSIVKKLNVINGDKCEDGWVPTLNKLQKTMFVCRKQKQAKQVKKYFDRIGVNTALSVSDTDTNSSEIKRFKKESDCLVLIVVGRGILGFNYKELVNVVDMTTSQNIDRIYQLMARVIRKHPKGKKKLFFKLSANGNYTDYYKYVMTAVLCLADKKYFTKYNGKNFKEIEVPVIKIGKQIKVRKQIKQTTEDKRTKKGVTIKPIEFEGLPAFQFFKDNVIENSLLNEYTYTTINYVRNELLGTKTIWTLDKCKESASNYNRPVEWRKNEINAYSTAVRNGWIEECTSNMQRLRNWTLEKCKESALNYNRPVEWRKNETNAYSAAVRNGWIEECTSHMQRLTKWTLEKCKESALKYNTPNEWCKGETSAYCSALKQNWADKCTVHMNRKYISWTFEQCKKSALKYNTPREWQKNDSKPYDYSYRKGWFKLCTTHMQKKTSWTYEMLQDSASKFNSRRDWKRFDKKAYNVAVYRKMLNELTTHMI
jgi:superfamily II DNA or RNA helicase